MYSIASWSPSQSDPLTVSYMCQRQSSSPMLPSAAAMPPCAATVCERVGNTLVMQAVLQPRLAAADHGAQARAAGADHDDVVACGPRSDRRGRSPPERRRSGAVRRPWTHTPNDSLRIAKAQASPTANEKNVLQHQHANLRHLVVHVVLDDHLHAEPHVIGAGDDEQQHRRSRPAASRGSAPPPRDCGRAARSR